VIASFAVSVLLVQAVVQAELPSSVSPLVSALTTLGSPFANVNVVSSNLIARLLEGSVLFAAGLFLFPQV
jgi:hypothetical protein